MKMCLLIAWTLKRFRSASDTDTLHFFVVFFSSNTPGRKWNLFSRKSERMRKAFLLYFRPPESIITFPSLYPIDRTNHQHSEIVHRSVSEVIEIECNWKQMRQRQWCKRFVAKADFILLFLIKHTFFFDNIT